MTQQPSLADLKSGFLIFLIALPLCLGISMASSCPPVAGIITAMVGGLLSTFLGSARLSIKGPAAGLIVVILGAVSEMGYTKFLGVAVVAALFQIIFSKFNAGKIAKLMPHSVIHGMLAAIGIIIVAKQLHVMFGVIPQSKMPLELIAELPQSILNANPEIVSLGLLTLLVSVFVPVKKVPPALISLMLVLPLALLWHLDSPHHYRFWDHDFQVGPKFLVTLPSNFFESFVFPDFSALNSLIGWKYVVMLALIGSIESLLTVLAIDSLDPQEQKSDLNKDLFSTGVGNLVCALIGGLPMISEVVRSKANIDAGAKSQWSNFYHAAFLLVSVTLLTPLIHEIPLSALAALLIITGFRLASPKEFYKIYKLGAGPFAVFLMTLVVTLKVNLLMGVLSGVLLKLILDFTKKNGR